MDLLFKRYASPFVLLDNLILTNSLSNFINDFYTFIHDDIEDKAQWEYFLHRVFDMSFEDYLEKIKKSNEKSEDVDLNATVKKSFDMLQTFTPESEV